MEQHRIAQSQTSTATTTTSVQTVSTFYHAILGSISDSVSDGDISTALPTMRSRPHPSISALGQR